MLINFLLISRPEDKGWPLVLRQALAPLGSVEFVSEDDIEKRIAHYQGNAVIILDAAAVGEEVPAMVSRLRRQCPECRIIVTTSSPTWQRARDALQAGAVDYIRKSWDRRELQATFKEILNSLSQKGSQSF